jgi:hypothetical protein
VSIGLRLTIENAIFFGIATGFLAIAGAAWKDVEPFKLPEPLPAWFRLWFGSVIVLGVAPPLAALVWSIWQQQQVVWTVLIAYFVMLGLQILSESLALRQFHSVVWVMVPYLYVPYRLWQLYEGLTLTTALSLSDLLWLRWLLIGEVVVWGINYLLDLAQLPRLFWWPGTAESKS